MEETSILQRYMVERDALLKEQGACFLRAFFMSNVELVCKCYRVEPFILLTDFNSTPPAVRSVFWCLVDASMNIIGAQYGLSRQECEEALDGTIQELVGSFMIPADLQQGVVN